MQVLPSLLRQVSRSQCRAARTSSVVTTSKAVTRAFNSSFPKPARGSWTQQPFVCRRCELRFQSRSYSSDGDKNKPATPFEAPRTTDSQHTNPSTSESSNTIHLGAPPETSAENTQASTDVQFKAEKSKDTSIPKDETLTAKSSATETSETSETSKTSKTSKTSPSPKHERYALPSWAEARRSQLSKQFAQAMDNLQGNVFIVGQRLNDLTGYSAIEILKKEIEQQESNVRSTRENVRAAKQAYQDAVNLRSSSQREVNELLQRKHAWSARDLERFTELYRSDHENEQGEVKAQEALMKAEQDAEEAASKLSRSILSRYHEEQVWSDKIRRMSTWGTWGLMGVNVLLFLVFQVLVEPWRRRRLVKGFEEKVQQALEREKTLMVAQPAIAAAAVVDAISGASSPVAEEKAAEAVIGETVPSEQDPSAVEVGADPAIIAAIEEAVPGPIDASEVEPSNDAAAQQELATDTFPTAEETVSADATPILTFSPKQQELPSLLTALRTMNTQDLQTLSTHYQEQLAALFATDTYVTVSQRDLTTVALQGAAAGAATVWILVVLVAGGLSR